MKNLLLILALTYSIEAFSNGGPIDGSAVYKTGDIVLINQSDIKLIQEDLKIRIEGDYSIVNVKYRLKNNSYANSNITYGFPIQFIRNEVQYELEWQDEYLPEIEFLLDGEKLEIKHQVDISTEQVKIEDYGGMSVDMRKSWHVVDFTILKKSTVVLSVNYKVKNGFEDWATTKKFFPSFSERKMSYAFSPAKNWGDGIVSNFNVEIDAHEVLRNGGSINISGLQFIRKSGIYSFNSENFNLKDSKDLNIMYDNKVAKLSDYITDHRISHENIKSISTTSQLEGNFKPNNLIDSDIKTAWVEGQNGNGIGEQIVIELDDFPVSAICLINGYTKSKGTYTTNGKVKKIKLEREIVNYDDPNKVSIETEEVRLKNLEFREITETNLNQMVSIIGDYGDGFVKVRKITLTILEVYEGSKYSDTCISEILLLGY